MKKRVLVFPCGSEIGLELHRSLAYSTHFELYGGSSIEDHGAFVYRNYISDIPTVDDPDFIDKLNEVIDRYGIDFVFPAHDSVVLTLARAADEGKMACEVVTSPLETCVVARSKQRTYEAFEGVIKTPRLYSSLDTIQPQDFPIFLKPDVGQGSKGTYKATSQSDITYHLQKDASLLLLEYLPGKEFTIDCFTDKNGNLLFAEGRERIRIAGGISVNSTSVIDERFPELAKRINETLKFRGVWFFQVKENDAKELVLMEVAPRVAGTMGLARCKGVNLALLSLFDRLDFEVSVFENSIDLVIDRALENTYRHNISYSHVYIDFDDLIILEGKVNPNVMKFLFQCINNNVTLHLITKHKHNLQETLDKYRLSQIFDEVIWVKAEDLKHLHITEKNAIFIDDSFTERKLIHEQYGIPTYDAHMLESLMER